MVLVRRTLSCCRADPSVTWTYGSLEDGDGGEGGWGGWGRRMARVGSEGGRMESEGGEGRRWGWEWWWIGWEARVVVGYCSKHQTRGHCGHIVFCGHISVHSYSTSWPLIHTWHWLLHLAIDSDLQDADISDCNDIMKGKAHCLPWFTPSVCEVFTLSILCPYHIPNISFFAKFSAP